MYVDVFHSFQESFDLMEVYNAIEVKDHHRLFHINILGGTHLRREWSERIFLASHPPGGTNNTFVPLTGRDQNTFVSSEGGMHLYPTQGRKKHRFPRLRDRVLKFIMVGYKGHTCMSVVPPNWGNKYQYMHLILVNFNKRTTCTLSHIMSTAISYNMPTTSNMENGTPTTIQTCCLRD